MSLEGFIAKEAIALPYSGTVKNTANIFKNSAYSHLPVLNNNKLVGCIAVDDLLSFELNEKKIADYQYSLESFHASSTDLLLDVLTLFAKNETNILPVVDERKNYVGFYDLTTILTYYASSSFLKNEGTEIIIAKEENVYSMSEAVQIAESNGAKVLGIFTSKSENNLMYLNLKIHTTAINDVIEAYRRYEYKIISQVQDDRYIEELKNRSAYLQKFLDI